MPTEKNAAFLPTQYSFKLDRQRVKSCLARIYIHKAWRQVKMTFVPALVKVTYTQAKTLVPLVYCPSGRKQCKFGDRNIKDETMGHVPYIHNNLPSNQGNCNAPCDYTYTASIKKRKLHLSFRRC